GIACQSALKGIPIVMKDIAAGALDLGLAEADKLLVKRVEKGRLTPAGLAVEAVVEDAAVKRKVLAELEAQVRADTVLASNTSTIAISSLGEALRRPE